MNALTNRDREYLRVIYLLKGKTQHVGPMKLAANMGISKVCAFQKMQRLKALGYGTYEPHKGLTLNSKAITIIKQDMDKHHVIESFLQENLDLPHHQACQEAERLSESMSTRLFQQILKKTMNNESHCCRYTSHESLTPEIMRTCPWIKKSLKKGGIIK